VSVRTEYGRIEYTGDAVVECPKCFAGIPTADNHISKTRLPNGFLWTGVRCECGASYTVELTEKPT
jgi:hypothetical protein